MYIAHIIAAGELIVIEVVTLSKGISLKRIDISSKLLTPTPHSPNSPAAKGESLSYPYNVGRSNAVLRPVCPCFSKYLKRELVSSDDPKPANIRIVHRRPRYIVECIPRV